MEIMGHLLTNLQAFLTEQNYRPIDLQLSTTKHFIVTGQIITGHTITGNTIQLQKQALSLIIDTGANNSCLDLQLVEKLNLKMNNSDEEAVGLRTTKVIEGMLEIEQLQIGPHWIHDQSFAILDLSHLNAILQQMDNLHIDGVIGTDILLEKEAIIDFQTQKLYLKTIGK